MRPATCMSTSAVRMDSGMLIAATSVERTLNRNRKMVMIAKSAPRPPSRSRPSCDSSMKLDRSWTTVTVSSPGCAAGGVVEDLLDSLRDLDGVRARRLGHRQRERRVAIRARVAGRGDVLELDSANVAELDRCRELARRGVAPGAVTGCLAPTSRLEIWSTEVSAPIVDTGMRVPSAGSWPPGTVMLLACRTPRICWMGRPHRPSWPDRA